MRLKEVWKIVKESFAEFAAKKVPKLSAALTYYTIFSLPALLVIIIWLSDIFYGQQAVEGTVYAQIADFVGKDAAVQIQETIRNAARSKGSGIAATISIITLVLGAGGVFTEIQDSINHIWHLKAKPRKGRGLFRLLRNRLLSFSMVVVLGFLLLISLVINGIMEMLIGRLSNIFPQTILIYIANLLLSFVITAVLFAAIFKVLPDARIKWKHVLSGAITTTLLFMLGRFLISFYLGRSTISTTYGAAGSILLILVWVYYSYMILYLGAVFTRVFAVYRGSKIYPSNYAVWVEQKEIPVKESLKEKQAREKTSKKK
jgi:membrane protein